MLTVACSKQTGLEDNPARTNGVEDNPNGGGGSNTSNVPVSVLTAFNARYPNATRIEWKKLSDGNFKFEFLRGSVKWQVTFSPEGTVLKEEHD